MKIMEVRDLPVAGVKVVHYARFPDERGYFTETFRREEIAAAIGAPFDVAQANESRSKANVVRGLHFQWSPWQGKLVRPIEGRLIDLALDIRLGSPTFGKIVGRDMVAGRDLDEGEWIWLPPGMAHGVVFPGDGVIEYLCTSAWSPGNEASISPLADDIDWSLCEPEIAAEVRELLATSAVMNGKDRAGHTLASWWEAADARRFVWAPGEPYDIREEHS